MKLTKLPKLFILVALLAITSCTTINHSMREPNTRVNLNRSDFTLSDQLVAEASSTKIIGIDFQRLFTNKTGTIGAGATSISLASIPVVGMVGNVVTDRTANYSLYELMVNNPGYDVVFYPQYETKVVKPILGIGFLTKITTVKTTARLGKLNNLNK